MNAFKELSAVAVCLFITASSSGIVSADDKTLSPYFAVRGGAPDVLPLRSTDVESNIAGVIADVRVTQVYQNTGLDPISATYLFPGSTRASVHGMKMVVGDRTIIAKIREKQKARAEYDAAKREGKTASLLEQERPNVFQMSVANIMPGDRVIVQLRYTELLIPEQGVYEFVYPTVVGPRYAEAGVDAGSTVATPYLSQGRGNPAKFSFSGRLHASVPIATLSSRTHRIKVDQHSAQKTAFRLDDSEVNPANRDLVVRYSLRGNQIETGLSLYQGKDENFFLLMAQPSQVVAAKEVPAREYVFIVDVSGSMYGFPLDTAKRLLRDLIGNLRDQDRFNLILFSGAAELMEPRSISGTVRNIDRAINLIDRQQGGGGTRLHDALQMALKLPHEEGMSRSFVVVTDGYISAERETFATIRDNLGQANVFSFGIGSGVNRYLIEGLAKAGQGVPSVITTPAMADEEAARFRKYISTPVLTDIKLRFEDFDVYDVQPNAVPDLLSERPVVVFGKWRGAPKGKVHIHGRTGAGRYAKSFDVESSKPSTAFRPLRYLWARERIATLSDFGTPTAEEEAEVLSLGLHYNLMTKYTSFIAVLDEVRNPSGTSQNVNQPLPLPAGVSDQAIGVEVGAEPPWYWVALLAALLLGWTRLRRRVA